MENSPIKNYSIREKYFAVHEEKRIRRMQFFARNLISGIIIGLIVALISFVSTALLMAEMISPTIFLILSTIVSLASGAISYIIFYFLSIKRANDFAPSGKLQKWIQIIFITMFVLTVLAEIMVLAVELGVNIAWFSYVLLVVWFALMAIGVVSLVFYLVLLFRRGQEEENAFGENPINGTLL